MDVKFMDRWVVRAILKSKLKANKKQIEWVFVDGYKAVTWAHIVCDLSTHEKQIYGTYGQTQLVEKKAQTHLSEVIWKAFSESPSTNLRFCGNVDGRVLAVASLEHAILK